MNFISTTNIVYFPDISKYFHKYFKEKWKNMNYNGYEDFQLKLQTGNLMEDGVAKRLRKLLPAHQIFITEQTPGKRNDELGITDVLVMNDNHIVFGIECKAGRQPYRKCEEFNGWKPEYNCPLNQHSLDTYLTYDYPVFILNLQFNREFQAELVSNIVKQQCESRKTDYKRDRILNFNTENWIRSRDINSILLNIINIVWEL